jgi:two-component system capsular synthesis response regulator RcsB
LSGINGACVQGSLVRAPYPACRHAGEAAPRRINRETQVNENQSPIRVAILDDHPVVQHGMRICLSGQPDIEVVGCFERSRDLLQWMGKNCADVLVLDYSLGPGEIDGTNLIRAIRSRFAGSRILISSSFNTPTTVVLTAMAGASGFFSKEQHLSELAGAIRRVNAGGTYCDPSLGMGVAVASTHLGTYAPPSAAECVEVAGPAGGNRRAALSPKLILSPREYDVLRCCLAGMSIMDIAHKFSRSPKTISTQKNTAYRKLGIQSDIELFGRFQDFTLV